MPYGNPEDKKEWTRRWKKQSKENGYNKWLYARRRIRLDDARDFRATLESISLGKTGEEAQAEALNALLASQLRWEELGEPPHRGRGLHKGVKLEGREIPTAQRRGVSLADALKQLGLK